MKSTQHWQNIFGCVAWHSPAPKEANGFLKVEVPPPPARIVASSVFFSGNTTKRQVNLIEYDTETHSLYIRVNLVRF